MLYKVSLMQGVSFPINFLRIVAFVANKFCLNSRRVGTSYVWNWLLRFRWFQIIL